MKERVENALNGKLHFQEMGDLIADLYKENTTLKHELACAKKRPDVAVKALERIAHYNEWKFNTLKTKDHIKWINEFIEIARAALNIIRNQ